MRDLFVVSYTLSDDLFKEREKFFSMLSSASKFANSVIEDGGSASVFNDKGYFVPPGENDLW